MKALKAKIGEWSNRVGQAGQDSCADTLRVVATEMADAKLRRHKAYFTRDQRALSVWEIVGTPHRTLQPTSPSTSCTALWLLRPPRSRGRFEAFPHVNGIGAVSRLRVRPPCLSKFVPGHVMSRSGCFTPDRGCSDPICVLVDDGTVGWLRRVARSVLAVCAASSPTLKLPLSKRHGVQ